MAWVKLRSEPDVSTRLAESPCLYGKPHSSKSISTSLKAAWGCWCVLNHAFMPRSETLRPKCCDLVATFPYLSQIKLGFFEKLCTTESDKCEFSGEQYDLASVVHPFIFTALHRGHPITATSIFEVFFLFSFFYFFFLLIFIIIIIITIIIFYFFNFF